MENTRHIKNNGGQVMLTVVLFFMFASMTIVFGIINPILKQVTIAKNMSVTRGSYFLAQSSIEDVFYRLKNAKQVSATETLSLNGGTTNTTVVDTAGSGKKITSSAS